MSLPNPPTDKSFVSNRKSDGCNSVYEIPPPPRSLPWLQQQGNSHDIDGAREKRSSSQSDLLDDDSAFIANDDSLSRSYDERSLDFLSLSDNQSTVPDDAIDRGTFKRSSHARHSADQYLTMTAQPTTKVSVSFFVCFIGRVTLDFDRMENILTVVVERAEMSRGL